MTRNRSIAAAIAALVIVVTGAYVLAGGGSPTPVVTTTSAGVQVTSPYDLTEAGDDIDLATVTEAKFASVLLETPDGVVSYMVARDEPLFQDLAAAVAAADKTDEPSPPEGSALAFVMPDRVTVTFTLDPETGLLAREGRSWRPDGDLPALIRALTERAAADPE